MLFRRDFLPCGCRMCGCICPEHSGFSCGDPCPAHRASAGGGWGAEVAGLVALALFCGAIFVWMAVLSVPVPV